MKYIVLLAFCVFMGMMAISLGVGAAFPPINLVAKPIVCPKGEMDHEQSTRRSNQRGKTILEASWTCEDPPGTTEPISKLMVTAIAGSFYGLLMFLPLALLMAVRKRPAATNQPAA